MNIIDAGLEGLETALNYALSLDPEISRELSAMHGYILAFDLRGSGIKLFLIPDQNGRLQLFNNIEGDADCIISGSPFALMRSHFDENNQLVFSGEIQISGNTSLAQKFVSILKRLDIDLEEQLSRLTGDLIAHQVGEAFRQSFNWLGRNNQSLMLNMQEYLQEEARLLPTIFELEDFYAEVDRCREDIDRLEARLRLIQSRTDQ